MVARSLDGFAVTTCNQLFSRALLPDSGTLNSQKQYEIAFFGGQVRCLQSERCRGPSSSTDKVTGLVMMSPAREIISLIHQHVCVPRNGLQLQELMPK